jgi:hypothetical protein
VSSTAMSPPVDSLASELPIGSLSWENFERLCLRLARLESDVVGARLYGTAGQAQEGIDLYAPLLSAPGFYRVYQCKRVADLEPSVIKDAVKAFTEGSWASRARELVLCSSDELRTTKRVEAFEEQRLKLLNSGVALKAWAREDLSDLLRTKPEVVHDYFGQSWVERFCGPALAARTAGRLSPVDLTSLRSKLGALYQHIFAAHDPGLVTLQSGDSVSLRDRFTTPDVVERVQHGPSLETATAPGPSAPAEQRLGAQATSREPARAPKFDSARSRVPLISHLSEASAARRVIIGGPGSGKSTLLRFVALDLLSDAPREPRLAQLWGNRLPIWLPFGAWVERIERGDTNTPIAQVMRAWLGQWGFEDLLPLVENALKDRRLLLLLDGLDEWTSEDAARIALKQLAVFAEGNNVTVIATSRPDGFKALAADLKSWKTVELAPFSRDQQLELARRWYTQLAAGGTTTGLNAAVAGETAQRQALDAIAAISKLPDAHALAEVPLLLSTLLLLRVQNAALPANRFRAYEMLTQQLMLAHPKTRRAAAQAIGRPAAGLRDDELEKAYSHLAFRVHQESRSGLIAPLSAQKHLEQALVDETFGIGYSQHDASRLSRQLVDIGEAVSGVLVRRSPSELGFFHRCLQEHLASVHIASLPRAQQLAIVTEHAGTPHWREVILAFICRAQSGEVVEQAVEAIRKAVSLAEPVERLRLDELLAEIASGPAACPIHVRRSIMDSAALSIETSWHQGHRAQLLSILLSGVGLQSVRGALLPRLQDWFPERVWYREPIFRALRGWPDAEAWRHLSFALQCDNAGLQLTAAEEIALRWKGDPHTLVRLRAIARGPAHPMTRAAALKAWLDGWSADAEFVSFLDAPGSTLSNELNLVALLHAVKSGDRSPQTRDRLAGCLNHEGAHFTWHRLAAAALIENWRGDAGLRDLCISALGWSSREDGAPSQEHAWTILFEAFGGDNVVADALIRELDDDRQRFDTVSWERLGRNFRDHAGLTARLEKWFANPGPLAETRLPGAAQVGRTAAAKQALLNQLAANGSFWAARGLLDGWGMADAEVSARLAAIANGDNVGAGRIAFLLPRVLVDPRQCYGRLLELLRDEAVDRTDFVISGLDQLDRVRNNSEVVAAILERIKRRRAFWDDGLVEMAIRRAPDHAGVRALALGELDRHDCLYPAIAEGFAHDAEMRSHVARALRPLSDDLRLVIAEELLHSGQLDAGLAAVCEGYRGDRVPEVATTAAILMVRDRAERPRDGHDHVQYLREELSCYGPDHETRRQAAFAAALEVGEQDLIEQQTETIGDPVKLRVSLSNSAEPNRVLVERVLSRWEVLQARYPDAVLTRLRGDRGATPPTTDRELGDEDWAQLADVVDGFPIPRARLDGYLAARAPAPLAPPLLRYLARREPHSQRLRAQCMLALGYDERDLFRPLERAQVATEILVSQFRDDDAVWSEIAAQLGDEKRPRVRPGAFVALARARPQHSTVAEIAKRVLTQPSGESAYVAFYALCAVSPPSQLLDRAMHYWGPGGRRFGAWLYEPLVGRMLRDADVVAEFHPAALQGQSIPVKASLSIALAAVGGLTPDLRDSLKTVLKDEFSANRPSSFAFDPRSGHVGPTAALIVDILAEERGGAWRQSIG